jgi:hypothetical protein
MKPHRQNEFVRGILRVIDICVGFYLRRPVRWDKEPFRKATGTEWRIGSFFAACFPIVLLTFASNSSVHSFLDTAGDARHSIVWLYVGFIGLVLIGALGMVKIGPKVPLYFSIPTAIAAWVYCVWLLGFHSERIIHSA